MDATPVRDSVAVLQPERRKNSPEESLPQLLKALSARRLTTNYLAALSIVACLSIASHVTLAVILHADAGAAAVINMVGRQRMLSQRIVSLAAEYQLGDASALEPMVRAIDEFDMAESGLISAAETAPDTQTGRRLRAVYLDDADPLKGQIANFIEDARRIAAQPAGAPAIGPPLKRIIAQGRAPLIDGLNEVVLIQQQDDQAEITRLAWLQWVIIAVVLLTLGIEAIFIFRRMVAQITRSAGLLIRLARTDSLTDLVNRRGFLDACAVERSRAKRYGRPASLMMLDADHFKAINDKYGHEAGDEVLRRVAAELHALLRTSDVAARVGGEEFALLLPETNLADAVLLAERLRAQLAAAEVLYRGQSIRFTVSIGVTSLHDSYAPLGDVLHYLDGLMYRAKAAGRNRVDFAPPRV